MKNTGSVVDKETATATSTIDIQKTIEEKRLKIALDLRKFEIFTRYSELKN